MVSIVEISPGEGVMINQNDLITYDVEWCNNTPETGDVRIFLDSKDNMLVLDLDHNQDIGQYIETVNGLHLGEQPSGATGKIIVALSVNQRFAEQEEGYQIQCQATISMGGYESFSNIITNPYTYNPPIGNLMINKTVSGKGDKNKVFNFTVELDDKTVNGQRGDLTFTNGVANFTLKHGEQKETWAKEGTAYQVTEVEENKDGYATTYTNDSGTFTPEQDMVAAFINDRPEIMPPDPLTSKTLFLHSNGESDVTVKFTFPHMANKAISYSVKADGMEGPSEDIQLDNTGSCNITMYIGLDEYTKLENIYDTEVIIEIIRGSGMSYKDRTDYECNNPALVMLDKDNTDLWFYDSYTLPC